MRLTRTLLVVLAAGLLVGGATAVAVAQSMPGAPGDYYRVDSTGWMHQDNPDGWIHMGAVGPAPSAAPEGSKGLSGSYVGFPPQYNQIPDPNNGWAREGVGAATAPPAPSMATTPSGPKTP